MAGNRETKTQRTSPKQPAKPRIKPTMSNAEEAEPSSAADRNSAPGQSFDATTRHSMIAEAAYYRAERRGFAPGGEIQDWCEAESSVDDSFSRGSTH
jgi:hypothetical protein